MPGKQIQQLGRSQPLQQMLAGKVGERGQSVVRELPGRQVQQWECRFVHRLPKGQVRSGRGGG